MLNLMVLTDKFKSIAVTKFSFGKDNAHSRVFASESNALSMHNPGFGLGIPSTLSNENQLRGVFRQMMILNGVFLFNINGVNLKRAKKGFRNYEEAENNNEITEWELYMILTNKDYFKNCIFHNGKVHFKKRILWNSIMR